MDFVRAIVECGWALRKDAGIKTRQPLTKLLIEDYIFFDGQYYTYEYSLSPELKEIILSELNVKYVEDVPADKIEYKYSLDFVSISKEDKTKTKEYVAMLKNGNYADIPENYLIKNPVFIKGYKSIYKNGIIAALDTELTPDLILEGRRNDLMRDIQNWRKENNLTVTDRIDYHYKLPDHDIVASYKAIIEEETVTNLICKSDQ